MQPMPLNSFYPHEPNGRSQQEIEKRFNEADDDRKLFVGGLSWSTTDEDLLRYFARFGAVDEAAMKRDRNGVPRGFAFIIYLEAPAVEKVMQSGPHVLNGRKIDPKRARSQNMNGGARPRKIFVRNSKACSEEELREYFSKFGEIVNIDLPVYTNDNGSFSRREYCFIEFDSEEAATDACAGNTHTIASTTVETRKFDSKQSGAAVAKGGPPDLVRARRQRFTPYGMGTQNMPNTGFANSGYMPPYEASPMGNPMGSFQPPNSYQHHGAARSNPGTGYNPGNMSGFGGGSRFNGEYYGGFGNLSSMQSQASFGGMKQLGPNTYMGMNMSPGSSSASMFASPQSPGFTGSGFYGNSMNPGGATRGNSGHSGFYNQMGKSGGGRHQYNQGGYEMKPEQIW